MISTKDFLNRYPLNVFDNMVIDYPFKQKYRPLVKGNSKLNKNIYSFSLLPQVTCRNPCKDCYDLKSLRYKYTRLSRLYNTYLAVNKLDYLKEEIIKQVKKSRTIKYLRVHVGGDFFSMDYVNMWYNIADWIKDNKPEVKVYTYTKNMDIIPYLGNINVVESLLPNGNVNFNTIENIKKIWDKDKTYKICPVTLGNKTVKCGIDCTLCMRESKLLFVKH